jgi:hypothetical protein
MVTLPGRFTVQAVTKNGRNHPFRSLTGETKQKQKIIMSKKSVFCISTSRAQTDLIVDQLKAGEFSSHEISVLFTDKNASRNFVRENGIKSPRRAITGAGTGGLIGGTLGWIAGIGALVIPGMGPFIAAGPIMAALRGVAPGAAIGGIAGGLISLGIPEKEARRYEGKIKKGSIFISVHTENVEEISRAGEVFTKAGAQDICTTDEASMPANSRATDRPAQTTLAAYYGSSR